VGIRAGVSCPITSTNVIHGLHETTVWGVLVNFHTIEECLDHPTCDVLPKQWNELVGVLNVIFGAEITLVCFFFDPEVKG
jgi:hypothetical protein